MASGVSRFFEAPFAYWRKFMPVRPKKENKAPTKIELISSLSKWWEKYLGIGESVRENIDTKQPYVIGKIEVTDDQEKEKNEISLSGEDASSFEVKGTTLLLKAGTKLDFETKKNYSVTIGVKDTTSTSPNTELKTTFSFGVVDVLPDIIWRDACFVSEEKAKKHLGLKVTWEVQRKNEVNDKKINARIIGENSNNTVDLSKFIAKEEKIDEEHSIYESVIPVDELPCLLDVSKHFYIKLDPDNIIKESAENNNEFGYNPGNNYEPITEPNAAKILGLPQAMREMSWNLAASYMDRWFAGGSKEIEPEPSTWTEDDYNQAEKITVNSVAKYRDEAYNELQKPGKYKSEHISNLLKKNNMNNINNPECKEFEFGPSQVPDKLTKQFHTDYQIQRSDGGAPFYQYPDVVTGLLGNFSFYSAVSGTAKRQSNNKFDVTVDKLYIYLADAYIFEKTEGIVKELLGLGTWNKSGFTVLGPGSFIRNEDFRKFRELTGYGRDFLVTSDINTISLLEPFQYTNLSL